MLDVCVVEIKGVEPLTSCLQGRRSSQLSYSPMLVLQCTSYYFSINLLLITIFNELIIRCNILKYIEK